MTINRFSHGTAFGFAIADMKKHISWKQLRFTWKQSSYPIEVTKLETFLFNFNFD